MLPFQKIGDVFLKEGTIAYFMGRITSGTKSNGSGIELEIKPVILTRRGGRLEGSETLSIPVHSGVDFTVDSFQSNKSGRLNPSQGQRVSQFISSMLAEIAILRFEYGIYSEHPQGSFGDRGIELVLVFREEEYRLIFWLQDQEESGKRSFCSIFQEQSYFKFSDTVSDDIKVLLLVHQA